MRNLSFALLILAFSALNAASFRSISSFEAVKENYTANGKVKVDVNLILQLDNKDYQQLPIILEYRVNDSEFRDLLDIDMAKRGVVKSINLKEGDYVEVGILINSTDSIVVDKIKGSLSFTQGVKSFASADKQSYKFMGSLWREKEAPLFRIEKKDAIEKKIKFTVNTNESYNYDRLFIRVKVIHPAEGMNKISKTIIITDDEIMNQKGDSFDFFLDGVTLTSAGNYYFEIKHQHSQEWLNGVGSISYELVK